MTLTEELKAIRKQAWDKVEKAVLDNPGLDYDQIARMCAVSRSTLLAVVKERNLPRRKPGRKTPAKS